VYVVIAAAIAMSASGRRRGARRILDGCGVQMGRGRPRRGVAANISAQDGGNGEVMTNVLVVAGEWNE